MFDYKNVTKLKGFNKLSINCQFPCFPFEPKTRLIKNTMKPFKSLIILNSLHMKKTYTRMMRLHALQFWIV